MVERQWKAWSFCVRLTQQSIGLLAPMALSCPPRSRSILQNSQCFPRVHDMLCTMNQGWHMKWFWLLVPSSPSSAFLFAGTESLLHWILFLMLNTKIRVWMTPAGHGDGCWYVEIQLRCTVLLEVLAPCSRFAVMGVWFIIFMHVLLFYFGLFWIILDYSYIYIYLYFYFYFPFLSLFILFHTYADIK